MNDNQRKLQSLDTEWHNMSWSMREKQIEKLKVWMREDQILPLIKEKERANDLRWCAKFGHRICIRQNHF